MEPTQNPAEKVVGDLQKDFKIVGSHRVHSWYAWAIVGIVFGMALGIVYVANRSGQVENSDASMGFPGAYGQQQNEPGMMGFPVPGQPQQMLGTNEDNEQYPMIRRDEIKPFGASFVEAVGSCNCDFPSSLNMIISCGEGAKKTYIQVVGGDIANGSDGWDIEEVSKESSATVLPITGAEGLIEPKKTCKSNADCDTVTCPAPILDPAILTKISKEVGKKCSTEPATLETKISKGSVSCMM